VDDAIQLSIENERKVEELRREAIHESGLIWNRTSPGWRYYRAMHVYEELYTDQTLPEIAAVNELHSKTQEYYSDHIEKVVQSHKLKVATRQGQNATTNLPGSPMRLTTSQIEASPPSVPASEQLDSDSGLSISWKLRQRIREDCASPAKLADIVVVDVGLDEFNLKLSPHLSAALKQSGKQQKDQEFLSAIKQQAKCINEATIANYSMPSPTYLKRQKTRVIRLLYCSSCFCSAISCSRSIRNCKN
jgi:hypothetical protein